MPKLKNSEMIRFVGIDPGLSGGIAWVDIDFNSPKRVHPPYVVLPMPKNETETADLLREILSPSGTRARIEQVGAFPGQGVTAMFTFGRGYGFLRGILCATRTPFDEIRPQDWQRSVRFPTKPKEAKADRKKRLLAFSRQRFPALPIWKLKKGDQLACCDALLICESLVREYQR